LGGALKGARRYWAGLREAPGVENTEIGGGRRALEGGHCRQACIVWVIGALAGRA